MSAVIVRRVLFVLAPVELAVVALIAAGVEIPTPLRLVIFALLAGTVVTEWSLWAVQVARHRRNGLSLKSSAKHAMRHVIGDRVWGFITSEAGLVTSLVRLLLRRKQVPHEAIEVTYHRRSSPLMWTMVALLVIESVVIHLAIPWPTVRLVALVLGLYGLLWISGYIAGFAVHPHLLDEQDLVIRHGRTAAVTVPLNAIERIHAEQRALPGMRSIRHECARENDTGTTLHIAQGGRTNLVLKLSEALEGCPLAQGGEVTRIHFWADDPNDLIRRLPTPKEAQR